MSIQWKHHRRIYLFSLTMITSTLVFSPHSHSVVSAQEGSQNRPKIAFVGLHGGVFEELQKYEQELQISVHYLSDQNIESGKLNLSQYDAILIQHVRKNKRNSYQKLLAAAKANRPTIRIISISGYAEQVLPELARKKILESDLELKTYYGNSKQNLKRLLLYVLRKHLGRAGTILPALPTQHSGLYHPDHKGIFTNVKAFLSWSQKHKPNSEKKLRAVVAVHRTHLLLQQPRVVDALIRELEKQGVFAVAMIDLNRDYKLALREFKPRAIIHTCHSRESSKFREQLDIPHLHSMFFRKQSIQQWRESSKGLASNELAFQIVSQEIIGAIEPQIGSGTIYGGGSAEAFTPISDRIEHLVARAVSWMRLSSLKNSKKKVAIVYWNREMGKAELMRGSATGMFLNSPRSLLKVLSRLKKDGYELKNAPKNEDELIRALMDHGQQIGVWAPGALDKLARSGHAILIPTKKYQQWFDSKVPQSQREELIKRWGPAPGRFMVWRNEKNESFIVIPRIDLGNVVLLPQPLRGEAHDTSLIHDRLVPPPHHYLATYFWLQEGFKANAVIHFGTHGTEFLLPGKSEGLSSSDWCDMIMGKIPNINLWVINNLGESSPSRRRGYAVLIDHLTPPLVKAELSDELLNLHNDIDKWETLPEGILKEKFRSLISNRASKEKLDKDLHFDLSNRKLLSAEEIGKVAEYLHEIYNDTTPVSLHVLGETPREDLLIPYLVVCLGQRFLDALKKIIPVPPGEDLFKGDWKKFIGAKAKELVRLIVLQGFKANEAVIAVGGKIDKTGLSKELMESIELVLRLKKGFASTGQEIDNLLRALSGRFVPPGPGNSPDRNPSSLPTGRNMYILNPEEVPSRPSWKLGKTLVDQLLTQQLKTKKRYPKRIGFTLSSFATFQDFGVMESQILYLMGVRPVWDVRDRVVDVELIPAKELGRPRIDVFLALGTYYRDMLPTRMRLLDKATRLVCSLKENGNSLYANSQKTKKALEQQGISIEQAQRLSQARIFGYPPGQMGNAAYYYLVERSGEWDSRAELMEAYLDHVKYVYTEGMWGEPAQKAYNQTIQNTEIVLRSWSDRTRSPLSNKYTWYKGGSLCLAVKHVTGKEPDFILSDLRDTDSARIVKAEDALRQDFRVRLFNRKWIEGMKKEGYAGADQIAKHVSNAMGWEIMRQGSISDDIWEEIVNIYIRDKRNLAIREWFEKENPFAFQEMTEILLETIRKGYWSPNEAMKQEIATEYARSVARHGEGGGLFAGGNKKLEDFVEGLLRAPGKRDLDQLLKEYKAQARAASKAPGKGESSKTAKNTTENVQGHVLTPQPAAKSQTNSVDTTIPWRVIIFVVAFVLLILGYRLKWGMPKYQ